MEGAAQISQKELKVRDFEVNPKATEAIAEWGKSILKRRMLTLSGHWMTDMGGWHLGVRCR
jgi:hypothetical protein